MVNQNIHRLFRQTNFYQGMIDKIFEDIKKLEVSTRNKINKIKEGKKMNNKTKRLKIDRIRNVSSEKIRLLKERKNKFERNFKTVNADILKKFLTFND